MIIVRVAVMSYRYAFEHEAHGPSFETLEVQENHC
jgi:hypothetical protein